METGLSTLNPILLYLLVIVEFSGYVVPIFVAVAGLRRGFRSVGFNRWLYLYVAHYSLLAFGLLALVGRDDIVTYVSVQLACWLTLPLWLAIREMTRQTRASVRRTSVQEPSRPTSARSAA